jgi:tetratricopeptide (TPR) repeat protein
MSKISMQKSNTKAGNTKAAPPVPRGAPQLSAQQKAFDAAMQAFHMRDFAKAKQHFEASLEGPVKEIQYAAKQHLLMCQKRMARETMKLESAEDHYNYGVSLMNQRELDGALQQFDKALKLEDADHVHYAMALVYGLKHDVGAAAKHLRRAIEIAPRNRSAVQNDPDFSELLQHAQIRELLTSQHSA